MQKIGGSYMVIRLPACLRPALYCHWHGLWSALCKPSKNKIFWTIKGPCSERIFAPINCSFMGRNRMTPLQLPRNTPVVNIFKPAIPCVFCIVLILSLNNYFEQHPLLAFPAPYDLSTTVVGSIGSSLFSGWETTGRIIGFFSFAVIDCFQGTFDFSPCYIPICSNKTLTLIVLFVTISLHNSQRTHHR